MLPPHRVRQAHPRGGHEQVDLVKRIGNGGKIGGVGQRTGREQCGEAVLQRVGDPLHNRQFNRARRAFQRMDTTENFRKALRVRTARRHDGADGPQVVTVFGIEYRQQFIPQVIHGPTVRSGNARKW